MHGTAFIAIFASFLITAQQVTFWVGGIYITWLVCHRTYKNVNVHYTWQGNLVYWLDQHHNHSGTMNGSYNALLISRSSHIQAWSVFIVLALALVNCTKGQEECPSWMEQQFVVHRYEGCIAHSYVYEYRWWANYKGLEYPCCQHLIT